MRHEAIKVTNTEWVVSEHVHHLIALLTHFEPRHDKTNKMAVRPVWSESLLSAWRNLGSLATDWAHSEDWSDWADAQADPSLSWTHTHFVGFVMSWLIWGHHNGQGTTSQQTTITNEPLHEKTCLPEFPTRSDSNWPAQLQKLAWGLQFWLQKLQTLHYLGSEQQRHWSDWADAQADLCLRCSHIT